MESDYIGMFVIDSLTTPKDQEEGILASVKVMTTNQLTKYHTVYIATSVAFEETNLIYNPPYYLVEYIPEYDGIVATLAEYPKSLLEVNNNPQDHQPRNTDAVVVFGDLSFTNDPKSRNKILKAELRVPMSTLAGVKNKQGFYKSLAQQLTQNVIQVISTEMHKHKRVY